MPQAIQKPTCWENLSEKMSGKKHPWASFPYWTAVGPHRFGTILVGVVGQHKSNKGRRETTGFGMHANNSVGSSLSKTSNRGHAVRLSLICVMIANHLLGSNYSSSCCDDEKPAARSETLKPNDEPDEPDQAAEMTVDVDAMVAPILWFRRADPSAITVLHVRLRSLLAVGMKDKDGDLEKARAAWGEAHDYCPEDPRVSYATGLILAHHKRPTDALKQFEQAARLSTPPFIPALQALAWVQLRRGNLAASDPFLRQIATAVTKSGPWPTDKSKQATAEWLGKAAGFVQGPGHSLMPAEQVERLIGDLGLLLTGDERTAFDSGRSAVDEQYAELARQAMRPPDELARETAIERQALEHELAELKAEHASLVADLDATRQANFDAKKEVVKNMAAVRANRSVLRRTGDDAADRLAALLASRPRESGKRKEVRTEAKVDSKTGQVTQERKTETVNFSTEEDLEKYRTEVLRLQSLLNTVGNGLQQAKLAAQQVKTRRIAVAQLPEGQGDKKKFANQLQHRIQRLSAQIKFLDENPPTPERLQAQLQTLNTYIPFDLHVEKDRLIASLKTPLPRWTR